MRWLVPVRIVEYGRVVLVEAETASEARKKARKGEWLDGGDAAYFDITSQGKIERESMKEVCNGT